MSIEELAKALYYLNISELRNELEIDTISDGIIWFSDGGALKVSTLVGCYEDYISLGKITTFQK